MTCYLIGTFQGLKGFTLPVASTRSGLITSIVSVQNFSKSGTRLGSWNRLMWMSDTLNQTGNNGNSHLSICVINDFRTCFEHSNMQVVKHKRGKVWLRVAILPNHLFIHRWYAPVVTYPLLSIIYREFRGWTITVSFQRCNYTRFTQLSDKKRSQAG